ncbi:MAG: mechanosensitive ion channel family protein [Betaproteobacteria bacterium]|nr:mechanosensitive ion channel family protein [Betaproteobacteria bacterium]
MSRVTRAVAALALAIGAFAAVAADPPSAASAATESSPAAVTRQPAVRGGAPVVVFNRTVATYRSSFLGVPPAERAEEARKRIVAALDRGGPSIVGVEKRPGGAALSIDGRLALIIANEDLDQVGGELLDMAAADAKRALEQVIAETHEARSARLMLVAALWAGGATVVYLVLLWLLHWLGRILSRRVVSFASKTVDEVRIGGTEILRRDRALRVVRRLLQAGYWGAVLLLTYQWIGFVLGRFPYTRPWGEQLNAFLADTASAIVLGMANAVPELLIALAIFLIARGVNGMLGNFFDRVQSGRVRLNWLDADSARPTRRLASVAVWVFALVMAYPYIPGSGTEAFKGLSVLLGLMVSIGASGVVGQAASGLILMYTRTFRPGEFVRVADHEGTVIEMGMFTTRVRTGLGEELTLPNSLVLGSVTKNYSRAVTGRGFILDTVVTIGYDVPWRQVHAMLNEAARRTEGVVAEPPPRVFQTALSDFYVEYRLVCQAIPSEPRPRAEVLSALHASVQDVFNEFGVQIMSPHYLGDPEEPKTVPPAAWHAAPAVPPAAPSLQSSS